MEIPRKKKFLIKKGDGTRRLVEGGGEWGGWWRTVNVVEWRCIREKVEGWSSRLEGGGRNVVEGGW